MKSPVKQHTRSLHAWLTNTGLTIALLALAWHLHGSATINFFNSPTLTNLQSDNSPMDATFSFQVGTFNPGFDPNVEPTSGWAANWNAMPLLSGTEVMYNTVTDDFQGVAMLDDNATFAQGTQAYIWGYTSKTADSNNPQEWILITNDAWDVPDAVQDMIGENPPFLFWWLDDANTTTVIGSLTPEFSPTLGATGNAMQSAQVPEPSTGLLLLAAATTGLMVRRRR